MYWPLAMWLAGVRNSINAGQSGHMALLLTLYILKRVIKELGCLYAGLSSSDLFYKEPY